MWLRFVTVTPFHSCVVFFFFYCNFLVVIGGKKKTIYPSQWYENCQESKTPISKTKKLNARIHILYPLMDFKGWSNQLVRSGLTSFAFRFSVDFVITTYIEKRYNQLNSDARIQGFPKWTSSRSFKRKLQSCMLLKSLGTIRSSMCSSVVKCIC